MKLFLTPTIILVFLSFITPRQEKNSLFIEYSTLIQKGEDDILNEKLNSAFEHYKEAIGLTDRPLASDCFTALQLSVQLKKDADFNSLLKKSFTVGLRIDDLQKDSLLNSYIEEKDREKQITSKSKKYAKIHLQNIDRFLLDTITKISNYDNKWKVHFLDSLSSVDSVNIQVYRKKYDSIVSGLVEEKLMPIIAEHGYPGQRKIGIERVDFKSDPYNYSMGNNRVLFVLLHYYSYPRSCQYNDMLYNEVRNGNMRPEQYASIIDFQAKYGNSEFCEVHYYNQWWSTDDSSEFKEINQRRAEIGLEPFEVRKKKYERGMDICREIDKGNYKHIRLFYWCG